MELSEAERGAFPVAPMHVGVAFGRVGHATPQAPQSSGVVVSVSPSVGAAGQGTSASYVVQLTNTSSAADSFSLQASGLPQGVAASFGQGTVEVPPGASQFVCDVV